MLLEALLDLVELFLDHVHRFVKIVMQLFADHLDFWLEVLAGLALAVLGKLRLELLATS